MCKTSEALPKLQREEIKMREKVIDVVDRE